MATATQEQRLRTAELNGWNLEEFSTTVDSVRQTPDAGRLVWRERVSWDSGFASDARVREIEQLGNVMHRKFTLRSDHPRELLGDNTGPTAVEILLSGLGACIAGTFAAHATAKGVRIEALEVELEGNIDLNGFLQLAPIRAGLNGVRARVRVRSDAAAGALSEILETTRRASPVYDSLANAVTIDASVERVD